MNFLQTGSDDALALGLCAGALLFSGVIMYFSHYLRPQLGIAQLDEADLARRLTLHRQEEHADRAAEKAA